LSIWTVLGATPVRIFWIFVLCQFVWRPITAADVSRHVEIDAAGSRPGFRQKVPPQI